MFLCYMNGQHLAQLQASANYFKTGATKSYAFRKEQLQKLKAAVLAHEKDLHDALYADLKKSPEESWVTETGFLLAEINHTLKHLKEWMAPKKVSTNLLNLPGKSFIYKEPLGVVLLLVRGIILCNYCLILWWVPLRPVIVRC